MDLSGIRGFINMCGISILIRRQGKLERRDLLQQMTDLVRHRGPDGEGFRFWANAGFGHRRLAIIDVTAEGCQPMSHEHLTLTFNGAIYNHAALKEELQQRGYHFNSSSDTEVLLKSWHCWGEAALQRFRGMWAFAIHDAAANTITLCRDRFGIKPLNYTLTPGYFAAGSEIKQFFALPDFKKQVFEPAIFDFLRFGKTHHNEHTFYKEVRSLAPGHLLRYHLNTHQYSSERYYSLAQAESRPKQDAAPLFRERFEEAVKLHLVADVPLAFALSGGLDSSAIVCMGRNILGAAAEMHTITSCNRHKGYDEQEYSALVEQACTTVPHNIYPQLDKLFDGELLRHINYHHDGPIPGGSHFSEYSIYREAARQGQRVMLGGQGSDEILGGYPEFYLYYTHRLLADWKIGKLLKAVLLRAKLKRESAAKILLQSANLFLSRKTPLRSALLPKSLRKSWYDALVMKHPAYFPGYTGFLGTNSLREASLLELTSISIPYQLHSEDRNSMMFSVESRVPFLDHLLVEAMVNLEPAQLFNEGLDKMPLRDGLCDLLPEKICKRSSKLGFASSEQVWMAANPEKAGKLVKTAATFFRDFVHADEVSRHFDTFISDRRKYDALFFRLISLHAWWDTADRPLTLRTSLENDNCRDVSA